MAVPRAREGEQPESPELATLRAALDEAYAVAQRMQPDRVSALARSIEAATRRYGRDVVKCRCERWGHVDHMDRHHAGLETMAMIRRQIVQGDYG